MPKLKHKLTRKSVTAPTSLTDATIFSKTYQLALENPVTKSALVKLAERLIQDIGRPLSHNGIIVGHIKLLVKVAEDEFAFLSLTRLEQVDIKTSSQWENGLIDEYSHIHADVNVLVFGHSKKAIEEVVADSLASVPGKYE